MKYNQPKTEVTNLKTASLMDGLVVSFGNSSGNPEVHAPSRGDFIP